MEASQQTGVSAKALRRWTDRGTLRSSLDQSGRRRIQISELERVGLSGPTPPHLGAARGMPMTGGARGIPVSPGSIYRRCWIDSKRSQQRTGSSGSSKLVLGHLNVNCTPNVMLGSEPKRHCSRPGHDWRS